MKIHFERQPIITNLLTVGVNATHLKLMKMRTMRRILILLTFAFVALQVKAVRAFPVSFDVTLSDGTQTTVRLWGDEYCHFYITAQGDVALREGMTWRKATEAETAETRRQYERSVLSRQQMSSVAESSSQPFPFPEASHPFPHVGTPRVLVIMASFSNKEFVYSRDDIDNLLNSRDYVPYEQGLYKSYGSVAQFFNDCSEGKYRPQFDVVGPYKLPNDYQYYGDNRAGSDKNRTQFLTDACDAALADGVDFSQYDADGDGYLDLVYVYYAGYGEDAGADPSTLWPCSGIHNGNNTYSGKRLYRFGISNELFAYPSYYADGVTPWLRGASVLIHEMGHTLGLPDVYPTVSWADVKKYDNQSMEFWDIMDNGTAVYLGYYPTPYSAWEREWLGWTEPIEELTTSGTYTLKPLAYGGKAYRIYNPNDATHREFYVLENIANGPESGWYCWMPGNGLLVTHINYNATTFANFNNPNNIAGKPGWTIVPANGTIYSGYRAFESASSPDYMSQEDLQENYRGNTLPGRENITSLAEWKEYSPVMSFKIDNVVKDIEGNITFDFYTEASAIRDVVMPEDVQDRVFTIDGRKAGGHGDNLPKGIYIVNGKKVVW